MTPPTTNITFGQMQHAEYEAAVSRNLKPAPVYSKTNHGSIIGKIGPLLRQIREQISAPPVTNQQPAS